MLNELRIDELLDKVDSRYGLVLASARRARQINEYAATLGLNDSLGIPGPQVHTRSQHPLSIAIEELRNDRLTIGLKLRPGPEHAPVPEDEVADPVAEEAAGEGILTDEDPQAKAPEEADEELNSDRGTVETSAVEDNGDETGETPEEDPGPGAA